MRTREKIEDSMRIATNVGSDDSVEYVTANQKLIIEVLLDIRDCQSQIKSNVESIYGYQSSQHEPGSGYP